MRIRQHRGFGHGLLPGTDHDIDCPSCQRERAQGKDPKIEGTDPAYCPMGLTEDQVNRILGDKKAAFGHWARGITVGVCEGREYDHENRIYRDTECAAGPHGIVFYRSDIEAFLAGKPNLD